MAGLTPELDIALLNIRNTLGIEFVPYEEEDVQEEVVEETEEESASEESEEEPKNRLRHPQNQN